MFYFINNIFWQAALEIILIPIFSLINKDTNLHIFINVTSLYGLILLINEDSFIHTTYQKLILFPLPRFQASLHKSRWSKNVLPSIWGWETFFSFKEAIRVNFLIFSLTIITQILSSYGRIFQPCLAKKATLTSSISLMSSPPHFRPIDFITTKGI